MSSGALPVRTRTSAARNRQEFTFLGFTHYGGKTREGYFEGETSHQPQKSWAKACSGSRTGPAGLAMSCAKGRCYGWPAPAWSATCATTPSRITRQRCRDYLRHTERILFKWLNRKSQRRAYTWATFVRALAQVGWPTSRIRAQVGWPTSRIRI